MQEEENEICSNCNNEISKSKMLIHQRHCLKIYYKCECGQVVKKDEKEEHDQEFHSQVPCKYCGQKFLKPEVSQHQENCNKKPIVCQYCEAHIDVDLYQSHLKVCGSRTQRCFKCEKNILNVNFEIHQKNCRLKKQNLQSQDELVGQQYSYDSRSSYQNNTEFQYESEDPELQLAIQKSIEEQSRNQVKQKNTSQQKQITQDIDYNPKLNSVETQQILNQASYLENERNQQQNQNNKDKDISCCLGRDKNENSSCFIF